MLRVSDFCRGPLSPVPSSGSRRRRRPFFDHGDTDDEGESCGASSIATTDDEEEEEEEMSYPVTLRSWNEPSSSSSAPNSSACARIPLDVLKGLSLRDGDYAFLEKHILVDRNNKTRDTLLAKVAIRLQLMDEDEELQFNKDANNLCLVTPIVLTNLGVSPQAIWGQGAQDDFPLNEKGVSFRLCAIHDDSSSDEDTVGFPTSPWLLAKRRNTANSKRRMKKAGHVLLRPLGQAPLWPWFSLSSTTTTKDTAENYATEPKDNKYSGTISSTGTVEPDNKPEDDTWTYPSRSGAILQESKLCEVRYNSNNHKRKQYVCYYEVLRIISSDDEIEEEDTLEEDRFYITTPKTQFELDSGPLSTLSYVRRLPLPPPNLFQDTIAATKNCDNTEVRDQSTELSTEETNDPFVKPRNLFSPSEISAENDSTAFSCHPDCKKVANAFLDAPPLATVTGDIGNFHDDSRILHIVGTDAEHDLETCVTTAATMVGMQCLSIKGLAAFGYEYRRSKKENGGVTVRSPMIEQQLAGVDAALECIRKRRMEPCILHISDANEELASVAADEQLRCQIEDRLWAKLTEGVATIAMKSGKERFEQKNHRDKSNKFLAENRWDYRYTPRIQIVISTKTPLKRGPWLERLIFPSITLSLPDEKYIDYLWNVSKTTNSNDKVISNKENEEENVPLSRQMMSLLRGRPAKAIVQLKQLMSAEMKEVIKRENIGNVNKDVDIQDDGSFQCLQRLCKDFDAGQRTASSDVARISNVSWQDVGGLDHVRAEILDAIELPLKHPHLFPPNTGRSGILLFGPPGTGKTLVAKAVATECGLPFLSVKGPELLGSYIGESEANIRKVFSSARIAAENNLPAQASILFFDELDSLAPKRGGNSNHGGGVMERIVASLLAELDGGFNHKENHGRVFVLGATNRPDLLDPSLLRPGRLDRLVYLGIPTDNKERARVLASQLRKMKLEGNASEMAKSIVEEGLPPRLSGADMSKLSSGAMLHAIRRLCREADRERDKLVKKQGKGGKSVISIDEILESWGEEKCTPIITLDDLRLASKDVSSSVSDEEMQRYERLRIEHETSSGQAKRT